MIPNKTIEELINNHATLEKELSSGKLDKKVFADKSKEYSDLDEIIKDAQKYILFENDKLGLEKILQDQGNDQELKNMAELINEHIPADIRMDYLKMVNDVYITKQKRDYITSMILEILQEYGYYEEG